MEQSQEIKKLVSKAKRRLNKLIKEAKEDKEPNFLKSMLFIAKSVAVVSDLKMSISRTRRNESKRLISGMVYSNDSEEIVFIVTPSKPKLVDLPKSIKL